MTRLGATNIYRFLVTTEDEHGCMDLWMPHAMVLNHIETRGKTSFFTCWGDQGKDAVIETARKLNITLQMIDEDIREEKWITVVQGDSPAWEAGS